MKNILILSAFILIAIPSCQSQEATENGNISFEWKKGTTPQNEFKYHIALAYKSEIFVVGGDNEGAFEVFDTKNDTWRTLPDMPGPRIFISGTILEESLYVIGGMDSTNKYVATVEKYDLSTNRWTTINSLSTPRSRLSAVTCNRQIYAIGGLEGTNDKNYENSSIVECYDPKTSSWQRVTDMPTPRHGHSAIVMNDKILVAGGYTDSGATGIVEVYDPKRDRWTSKSPMPTKRGFFGMADIDNYAYAIAGRVSQDKGPIEQYDPENDRWTPLDPFPEWRNRFGIAKIKNKVYIIGGENNPKSILIGELKK